MKDASGKKRQKNLNFGPKSLYSTSPLNENPNFETTDFTLNLHFPLN